MAGLFVPEIQAIPRTSARQRAIP